MARGPNGPSPNQTNKGKFVKLCNRIKLAGISGIARKSGISRETIRKWVNGETISPANETAMLKAMEEIILTRRMPNAGLASVGDDVIKSTAAYV